MKITHIISRMQYLSQAKDQERLGRRNLVLQEQQPESNPIFVVNVLIVDGLMKGEIIGAVIGTKVEIIDLIITILNHLKEDIIVAKNRVQIVIEIQTAIQIVVNVVGAVEPVKTQTQSNPLLCQD